MAIRAGAAWQHRSRVRPAPAMRIRATLAMLSLLLTVSVARAEETREIRIGHQFGFPFIPLFVMKEHHFIEQEAVRLGLPEPRVSFTALANGVSLNDGLLAGAFDLVGAGTPVAITVWSRTQNNLRVHALAALASMPFCLIADRPSVTSVRDFRPSDRIALPAVAVSIQAVVLRMAAAQAFGADQWRRFDEQTVSLSHPDAMRAMLSGRSEITAHFSNPPYQDIERDEPGTSQVLSSFDVLGGPHTSVLLYGTQRFHEANPLTIRAIIAALRAADAFILANPAEAGTLYARAEPTPFDAAANTALVRNPSIQFSVTPQRVMEFAAFLARIGQIPHAPADWRDLFFSELHNEPGS